MISDQSDLKESQTIEALVPMVDLFAVLAIVFMIYATDEIAITELTTANKIQEVVKTVEKMKDVVESIERESEARIAQVERESEERIQEIIDKVENDPKNVLAREADKTLEDIKKKRREKADELVLAFTEMLEAQQHQVADQYDDFVTNIEQKHEETLSKELVSLDQRKQMELEIERAGLRSDLEVKKLQLKKEQEQAVEKVRQESLQALAERESELAVEKMMALADQEADLEYQKESALAQAKAEHAKELKKRETVLKEEKRRELVKAAQLKEVELARQESALRKQEQIVLGATESELIKANLKIALEKRKHSQQLVQTEAELEAEKRQALEEAAQAERDALAEQEATLAAQKAEELRQAEAKHARQLAQTESELEAEKRKELERLAQAQRDVLAEHKAAVAAQAEAEAAQVLAQREAELDAKKRQELQTAAQAQKDELAEHKAAVAAQKAEELAQAEAEHARELAQAEADAEAEKQQALADAAQAEKDALADLQASLAAEKEKALADSEQAFAKDLDQQKALTDKAEQALTPFLAAAEAKQQIVDLLNENFKDYDSSAVEIDEKTGRVRLNFQESYFVRGSHELSQDMKDFLRIMIPKYARSIYENKNAARLVESLKISGMTSPIYMGRYIDINDTSPRSERARQYNMTLSNKRAVAMYNFIFDESEMGNYRYRTRLKKDMGIAALGYQNAQPVRAELVGKTADCIEYNCKKEQATILQFQLYQQELASF